MNDTVPSQCMGKQRFFITECLTICIKISCIILYELRYEPLHMELVGKSIFERSTGCGRRDQKRGDNFLTQLYLDR